MNLKRIEEILLWFDKNSTTSELSELMEKRDKLTVLSYGMAKDVGDSQTAYNDLYFIRRLHVSKTINKLAKEGLAISKSEYIAVEENQDIFIAEKEKESEAFKNSLLLKQINKILEAMTQRIALLRQELQ